MAAVMGGVVDQDNSTSKRQSHKITVREGYVSVMYHLHGCPHEGVVDQDNSTSKRQSHKITVREVYVSVVYHLYGCCHGGSSGPGQQHK
jgi:hypothetical protein